MGSWSTKSFDRWWAVKLGLSREDYKSDAMCAGTAYEHPVLQFIGAQEIDKQILLPELRLRVNLDGNSGCHIYEVKTHGKPAFRPTKAYLQQVRVQLYAAGEGSTAEIIAYRLEAEDYKNYFREIDPERIARCPVEQDEDFLQAFLPRLEYLRDCLMAGRWPNDGYKVHSSPLDGRRKRDLALPPDAAGGQAGRGHAGGGV